MVRIFPHGVWRGRPSRIARGAVVGFVLAAVLPFAPDAGAANAELQPNPTGYYTKTQDPFKTISGPLRDSLCGLPSPDPRTCADPSQLTGGTPGYPRKDNYIYVATINGDDDARGAIGVPLFAVPLGSTIRSLILDFYVENEGPSGAVNFAPDNPALQFCIATEGWAGQDAAPYESQPATNCEIRALPKKLKEEERSETTEEGAPLIVSLVQYRVDLMPMARAWAKGAENNGVMVLPTPDAPAIFEAPIRTPGVARDGMTLKVSYDPPAATPVPAPVDEPIDSAPTFGNEPDPEAAPEPEPTFDVPEDEPPAQSAGGAVTDARPASSGTPWWTYLGLPIGLAALAGLGRGTAAPGRELSEQRAGPVSRLMNRGPR